MKLIPTILSGGAGSRLWPLSRAACPKPFLTMADGENLLAKTYARALQLPDVAEILTVTNREFLFETEDVLRRVNANHIGARFVLEPFGRNTAAAVAAAALEVAYAHGEEALLLVLPADHVILDQEAFQVAVASAVALAEKGQLVTFGIKPTGPETGFGYIETEGHRAVRMIEKPPLDAAKEYIACGNYFWNSGMFCFTAAAILAELEYHAPDVLSHTRHALKQGMRRDGSYVSASIELSARPLAAVPDISLDYAVMEHTKQLAVVPCEIGWSDVGTWSAMDALTQPTDTDGNYIFGEALLYETTNCYIRSEGQLISAVGMQDLIVVATSDAVLIAPKHRSQDVKHVFHTLKLQGHRAALTPATTQRPWGTFTILGERDGYKIKHIEVKPGGQLSLQSHAYRHEHWVVIKGAATVVKDHEQKILREKESISIPPGTKHRLSNLSQQPLVMIEVQTGDYIGEDDIVRYDDMYGRLPTPGTEFLLGAIKRQIDGEAGAAAQRAIMSNQTAMLLDDLSHNREA